MLLQRIDRFYFWQLSRFIRRVIELLPGLEKVGMIVVYGDLWSDKNRNPGDLIASAIGKELGQHLGIVARAAKSAGVDQLNIAGTLHIDTSKIGKIDGLTLSEALRELVAAAGKPVALIIDEAQHALASPEGETAMTAPSPSIAKNRGRKLLRQRCKTPSIHCAPCRQR